jgi:hypothetical protein
MIGLLVVRIPEVSAQEILAGLSGRGKQGSQKQQLKGVGPSEKQDRK